jgi:glutamine synthetase
MTPNWGINHRGVALRIPISDAENRRIEHRPGGSDGNPYLVVAAILAGIITDSRTAATPARWSSRSRSSTR